MAFLEIEFLGTGTSTGVPVMGCECPVCQSHNKKNKRLRSSVLIKTAKTTLLVDSAPDLRQQALRIGLKAIDGVIYSHCHLDHVAGFDDLRAFCWHRTEKLPFMASSETMENLQSMYPWAFQENVYSGYVQLAPQIIKSPILFRDIKITPVPVIHGTVQTHGYVFEIEERKRIGYIPDVKKIPKTSMGLLHNLDVLVVDALQRLDHPTHFSIKETLELFDSVQPKQGIFTHMSHRVDYDVEQAKVPDNVLLAYDGLKISL